MELTDVIYPKGSNNTGGVGQYIYIVDIDDVVTMPQPIKLDPTEDDGELADLVTISANIVLAAGKSMKKVYVTLETGELKHDDQGEYDGKSFKNSLSILHPGSSPTALGFLAYIKNGSFVILVKEIGGSVRLLGTRDYPAKVAKGGGTTGATTAARKSNTIEFVSAGNTPACIFTGKVMVGVTEQVITL